MSERMPKLMWDLQKKEGRSCLTKTNFSAHNRMCQNSAAAFFLKRKHTSTHAYTHTMYHGNTNLPSVAVILTVWQIHLLFSKHFFL